MSGTFDGALTRSRSMHILHVFGVTSITQALNQSSWLGQGPRRRSKLQSSNSVVGQGKVVSRARRHVSFVPQQLPWKPTWSILDGHGRVDCRYRSY